MSLLPIRSFYRLLIHPLKAILCQEEVFVCTGLVQHSACLLGAVCGFTSITLRSLSNDDGDTNENEKKGLGLD